MTKGIIPVHAANLFDQYTYCGIAIKSENGKVFTVRGLRAIATVKVLGKVTCKNCLRAMG